MSFHGSGRTAALSNPDAPGQRRAGPGRDLSPQAVGAPASFQTAGRGSANPVAPNALGDGSDNPAGRAHNRRFTIAYATTTQTPQQPLPSAAPASVPPAAPGPRTVAFTENSAGTTNGTSTYQATVNGLVRSGPFAVLSLTVRCETITGVGQEPGSCASANDFGANNSVPPVAIDQDSGGAAIGQGFANAVYLTDRSGNEYVPVHDINNVPLTAAVGYVIPIGDSYPLWIYLPAPPPSAGPVTVVLPGGTARVTGVAVADDH